MTAPQSVSEEHIPVGQTQLYVLRGGSGRSTLVLHGIEGHEGWLDFHDRLATSNTVYAPSHPGYGHTPPPDWITSVPQQAVFYQWFLQDAGLRDVDLIGIGLGGWIAAEMAVMDTSRLSHLVLVNAFGVHPHSAELFDIFVARWRDVIEGGFSDAVQYQHIYGENPIQEFGGIREAGRTMTMRMCFKPYMFDPSLPGMLGKIRAPTLVVHAENDAYVPRECAEIYAQAIPGAELRSIDNCGHLAHMDQPARLAALATEFASRRSSP